jgi:hypothetical protein
VGLVDELFHLVYNWTSPILDRQECFKMADPVTVSDIFRRAIELRESNPNGTLNDLKSKLVNEFKGGPLPPIELLTIPEYDNIAPEEDWTAGLPIVLRGIQNEDWAEVAHGIIISLEQVENYPKESGREDDPAKEWRNRHRRIAEAEEKNLHKWMPEELMAMAKRNVKS